MSIDDRHYICRSFTYQVGLEAFQIFTTGKKSTAITRYFAIDFSDSDWKLRNGFFLDKIEKKRKSQRDPFAHWSSVEMYFLFRAHLSLPSLRNEIQRPL